MGLSYTATKVLTRFFKSGSLPVGSRGVPRGPVPKLYYYIGKTYRMWDPAGSHRQPDPGEPRGTPRGSVLRVRSLGGKGGGSLCVRSAQLLRARGAAAGRFTRNMSNFNRRSVHSGTLFRRRGPRHSKGHAILAPERAEERDEGPLGQLDRARGHRADFARRPGSSPRSKEAP